MAIEGKRFRALTFDCYGTLIDWEKGIRAAAKEVKGLEGCDLDRLIRERELAERVLLTGPYRIYSGILADSLKTAASAQGRTLHYTDVLTFVNTMSRWPTFPDGGPVLRHLAFNYSLAILSNVETKVLQASVKFIGAPFVALITAEDIQSYKPAPKHWEVALKRLHLEKESVLHVSGSLFHDIQPARALGFETAWINRRKEAIPPELDPASVFPDIESLSAALLEPEPGPAAEAS